MGQSSNFMLNKVGTFMYWENSWVNALNSKNFQTKILLLQKIIFYFFSDKLFNYFFLKKVVRGNDFFVYQKIIKQNHFLAQRHNISYFKNLNISRSWFIKYRNFIVFSIFCFFLKKKSKHILRYKMRKFFILFKQRRFKKTKRLLTF